MLSYTSNEKICAIVVTYNRKKFLSECLEAIRKQTRPVDAILIVDNYSTDGTPEFLYKTGYISELPPINFDGSWVHEHSINNYYNGAPIKIYFIRMKENTGSSGGYHEGLKRAYTLGYDWFWLMDDDVEPLPNALESMLSYKVIGKVIHPTKIFNNGEICPWEGYLDEGSGYTYQLKIEEFRKYKAWTCVNFGCFEGMLIHRSIVEKIGFPKKELFLCYDDTLYGFFASKYTTNVYIRDICFIKKIKQNNERSYRKLNVYLYGRNVIGYGARIISKSKKHYIWYSLGLIINLSIKFCYKLKPWLIYYLFLGILDGLLERWGKERRFF